MLQKLKISSLLILMIVLGLPVNAQKVTLSGYISDALNGEKLVGATVFEPNTKAGTACNNFGFYSISLPKDSVKLIITYVGYKVKVIHLKATENQTINIALEQENFLKEVEIIAEKQNSIDQRVQMSMIDVPILQIKKIPALLGEVDVLKALQLLPGVKSGGEGSTGIYVRGGGPDQNLILLDGVPVYNASHLFGFFSIFNADAIKSIQLYKGGFPARYGGRLSSVIDITMKDGNLKKFNIEGSIGIISSKLSIEGPIIKDRSSFIISARRTYIDFLARPIIKKLSNGAGVAGYYFYDVNSKFNFKVNEKNQVYLSYYLGNDIFYFRQKETSQYQELINNKYENVTRIYSTKASLGWGNMIGALRWNHIYTPKLFGNTTATYTQYQFNVSNSEESSYTGPGINQSEVFSLKYLSGIKDWAIKSEFDYYLNNNHTLRFGTKYIYHTFETGTMQYKAKILNQNMDTTIGATPLYANETNTFIEDEWNINNKLKVDLGVHHSFFFVKQKKYSSFQPRIAMRYILPYQSSLKISYAEMAQFIHLLTNSNIGLPTDLWVPATDITKPQYAKQFAIGLAKNINDNMYEASVEGYYKVMDNIIEYVDGANFFEAGTNDWQKKIEAGKGWCYGSEFLLQKKEGKLTGWIGYTLSWANRQFTNINFGEIYPYKYDRRHDVSIVGTYTINDHIDISATWVYSTGNALTFALSKYSATVPSEINYSYNSTIDYYGSRNNFRMPAYHRMDVGINIKKEKKWGERTFNISVYNAYNRLNPYFIYIGIDSQGNPAPKKVSLFPILPSISYSFKFK